MNEKEGDKIRTDNNLLTKEVNAEQMIKHAYKEKLERLELGDHVVYANDNVAVLTERNEIERIKTLNRDKSEQVYGNFKENLKKVEKLDREKEEREK